MMPGSTASPSDPSKAKVTSAINGVFVRPVAVAGIFRPVQEDPNKPPALPEKRRLSALTGDLRPCSSDEGPGFDDFNRRRQSWDTRQKEVLFGQALLRKTPRNSNVPDIRTVKSVNNGSSVIESSCNISDGVKIETTVKLSDSVNSPERFSKSDDSQSTVVSTTVSTVSRNDKELESNCDGTSAKSQLQPTVITTSKENKSDKITVNTNKTTNRENVFETQTTGTPNITKQTKKVYGLVKRESKTEISTIKTDSTIDKISHASTNISTVKTDSTIDKTSDASTNLKNITPKTKVYGLSKTVVKKDSEIGKAESDPQLVKQAQQICTVSTVKSENDHDSTKISELNVAIETSNVVNESRVSKSPPKNFRTVRRTSDVIAARIQNIFSNFQSEKPAPPLLKKAKVPVKENTESLVANEADKKDANNAIAVTPSEKSCIPNSVTPVNSSNASSKTPLVPEKKNFISEDKNNASKDRNLNSKFSTNKPSTEAVLFVKKTDKKDVNNAIAVTPSEKSCIPNSVAPVNSSNTPSKTPLVPEKKSFISEDKNNSSKDCIVNSKFSTNKPSTEAEVLFVKKTDKKDINNSIAVTPSEKSCTPNSITSVINLNAHSETPLVSEQKNFNSEDKNSSKDLNLSSKFSTNKSLTEAEVLLVGTKCFKAGERQVFKSGVETRNILGVNSEPPLKKADSKTEHSIKAASSEQGDKKINDIEGKMPIKKEDQSSSESTKTFLKAANQETDHKSLDPTAPSSTLVLNVNKEAGAKKNFIATNNVQGFDRKNCNANITSRNADGSAVKDLQKGEEMNVKKSSFMEGKFVSKSLQNNTSVSKTSCSITQSFLSSNSVQLTSTTSNMSNLSCESSSSKNFQNFSKTKKIFVNSCVEATEISNVEVTKIIQSTTPGIVPTVNVLYRTKSPQGSSSRDENRKKVVIETCASDAPISSALIISPQVQNNVTQSDVSQSVKEGFKTIESVKQSVNSSPKLPKKYSILNLQKQEVVSVDLSSGNTSNQTMNENSKTDTKVPLGLDQSKSVDIEVGTNTASKYLETLPLEPNSKIPIQFKIEADHPQNPTPSILNTNGVINHENDIHTDKKAPPEDSRVTVVDLGDWNKRFQRTEPEVPRAPLRRRAQRESLPPSLPLRSPSRFGSLKKIDDSSRYLPRSPSHSSLPQRYSYTEMLSKVCSMGVLPYVEPVISKSCSSSSSQVSELWSELSEEQSTATHASEMLEAETTERMRLEKEVHDLQNRYSQVQQRSNKMEMEILESKVYRSPELNGDLSEDEDPDGTGHIYKQRYERAVRDMEIMKRRIQQQHEEEMEQKSMLKKATDKRLAEALEDVDEERQIANQWKRKAQKCGAELQDIRLMLEEQMARNGELEKKQRRFDAELSAAQEEIKKERLLREKLMREKEQAVNEKYSIDQELQSTKLDSDMLHEKITQLNRELDELTLSSRGEEEVTQLKRAKQELERKCRDQEEELEEFTAQVQMLEQAKLRLEMSLEKVRQEHRREASVREEEIEEIRASFLKKIKNLEAQLESEQDERHQLVKQKHELERRIYELTDQPPPQDPEIERRLRRDLKRTKALLRDAQSMLEHTREGQSSKTLIRQLKNQLEDSEFAKATAIKARQAVETELQDCQLQLEEISRTKNEAETRCLQLSREKSAIQTQLEESEEEMAEVMKKYKAVVAQMSADQKILAEQSQQIAELETERQMLKEQLSEVSHKFEHLAGQSDDTHKMHWLDAKVRDLESKLELEQTTKTRLENQIARLKEQNDRVREECDSLRNKELQAQEAVRRLQRQIRDLREDYSSLQQKEADGYRKQHELEMALENTETDLQVTKNDLRLACQRIQDLQNALEDDLDSGTDVPDDSGSDSDTSFELSVLRNQSATPVQRCESIASNLSYDTAEDPRSRTSSFTQELSAFSRMMLKRTSMDFLG